MSDNQKDLEGGQLDEKKNLDNDKEDNVADVDKVPVPVVSSDTKDTRETMSDDSTGEDRILAPGASADGSNNEDLENPNNKLDEAKKKENKNENALIVAAASGDDDDDDPDSKMARELRFVNYYDDEINDMTWGRRIARYLSRYEWYFPAKMIQNGPSLDAAWMYFEHQRLPRHFLPGVASNWDEAIQSSRSMTLNRHQTSFHRRKNTKDILHRAEYGEDEEKTLLYSVWKTPEGELGDFGLGVGIYFWTLKVLSIIVFLAGIINIPNMLYFASTKYGSKGQSTIPTGLRGSVICTDTEWTACPNCTLSQFNSFPRDLSRLATATSAQGDELIFVMHNNCNVGFLQGLIPWIGLLFVVISVVVMNVVSRRREVEIDESAQTPSDYSISVENPPEDAYDPDEWRAFFSRFGDDIHVTSITVSVDNEELVQTLVKRRVLIQAMEILLNPDVEFDAENLDLMAKQCMDVPTWQRYLLFKKTGPQLLAQIRKLEEEAKEWAEKDYTVSNVFVTFEKEKNQRKVLNQLSVPLLTLWRGGAGIPENLKFRKKHVLQVVEPPEPSSVRWDDLDESYTTKMLQRLVSFTLVFGLIVAGAFLVEAVRRVSNATYAAVTIKAINLITPLLCKVCNSFESHESDGSRQASLYIKTTIFKWVNTAIVTAIITPFTDTTDEGKGHLIDSVYAIFFAELLTSPALKMLDIWGNIQRHFLGPRAPDQKRMNLKFGGGIFELAERYTEMTKMLFLTFFYSAVFPAGFFFASASLVTNYWVDKFSLFRSWGPSPVIKASIAEFSRNYFFPAALAAYAVALSYNYAGFPFDQLCETDELVPDEYVGFHNATSPDESLKSSINITINSNATSTIFCKQDFLRYPTRSLGVPFPALASFQPDGKEWMTEGQERATFFIGWTAVAVIAFVAFRFLQHTLFAIISNFFIKPYRERGEPVEELFSETREHFSYVPQVVRPGFVFPILVCKINDLDPELLSWNNPHKAFPYDYNNVVYDIPGLSEKPHLFDQVKSWIPKRKRRR